MFEVFSIPVKMKQIQMYNKPFALQHGCDLCDIRGKQNQYSALISSNEMLIVDTIRKTLFSYLVPQPRHVTADLSFERALKCTAQSHVT